MKKIVKCIIFILIFCIIWNLTFNVLWIEKKPVYYFYKEPKNSLDIVYIGSSTSMYHFNSTLSYDLYGFTTGLVTAENQPFLFSKNLIKEVRKYQKPELYIIDLYHLSSNLDKFFKEDAIRNTVDNMKFSQNKSNSIKTFFKYINLEKSDLNSKSKNNILNYEFSFLLYHNSWKNLKKNNFSDIEEYYKGYLFSSKTIQTAKQTNFHWDQNLFYVDGIKKSGKNIEILKDLMKYIKKEKLNVLFVIPPCVYTTERVVLLNYATRLLDDKGFKIINFNLLNDFSIDFEKELFMIPHLNTYGATKFTLYFSKYLHDHYKLKDHRKDKKYQSWENEYQRFKNDFKNLTKKNFDDILKSYQKKEGM